MIGVSARPILLAFGPVPTAVDMPVGVLRRKHDYKKKKKKKTFHKEYLTASGAEIVIWTGVVARVVW